ncbi:MAG: transcription initiation factor IIB family protein [Promethearchaeota archaeon]
MPTSEKNSCPECRNTIFITDYFRGQVVCKNCGVVVQEYFIDPGPEWRSFTPEEHKKRTRVGPKIILSLFDKGLTTMIGKENKDASGVYISPKKQSELYRLRKWQERTKFKKSINKNLSYAMNILELICSQLSLTNDIKEKAAYYYRKIIQKVILKGRSINGMIIASLYVVLKLNKRNAVIQLLNNITNLNLKTIKKYVEIIQRELNLKFPPPKPQDWIPLYVSKLSLSWQTGTQAINILKMLEKKINFSGKSPRSLASSALYCACLINNERRSQNEISIIAGVTEVTLRNYYKLIREKLKLKM